MEEYGPIDQNILVFSKMEISMDGAVIYGKIKIHMMVIGNMDKCAAKVSKHSQMDDSVAETSRVA